MTSATKTHSMKSGDAHQGVSISKAIYWIEGLFCGNCAASLEKKITALNIIDAIRINFTYSYMIIDHSGDFAAINQVELVINKLGYKLTRASLDTRKQQLEQQQKKSYAMLFFAFIFSAWSMLCAVVTYMHSPNELSEQTLHLLNLSSGIFSIPVVFIAGFHFHKMAWLALSHRLFNIDLLISTSALSAFFISLYFLWHKIDIVYFDTACMLVLLHLFGRTLDLNTKTQALNCLEEEMAANQKTTVLLEQDNKQLKEVDINLIQKGDQLVFRFGDKLPVDCELTSQNSFINTSILTGESSPVAYIKGDKLSAGFVNMGQAIHVKASCAVGHSEADYQLIDILVNKAKQTSHNDKINQLSSFLSKLIFVSSLLAGLFIFYTQSDLQMAFERILCVLVIACPCSLTIAMPMASLILNKQSIKRRLVINNCQTFLQSRKLSAWYFDKTGTLTVGEPSLSNIKILTKHMNLETAFQLVYQCVYYSGHIYSNLIRCHVQENFSPYLLEGSYQETLGCGIKWSAKNDSQTITLGSKKWLTENNIAINHDSYFTASYLAINNQVIAVFEFEDAIKKSAKPTLEIIRSQVNEIGMLSGDNQIACERISALLGIENNASYSALSPNQKQTVIKEKSSQDQKVGFVGDGLNDNLALMQAHIGVATKNAAALTKMSASVCLLTHDLAPLTYIKPLAALYHKLIQRNIIYAIGYNLIAIPIAILGNISPLVAITAMAASSISISINSYTFNKKMDAL